MSLKPAKSDPGKVAYVNARLVDPASGLDARGGLLTVGERIAEMGPGLYAGGRDLPSDATVVDCDGAVLAPGLVDMRVRIGEPGEEHKETIASASAAAAAGGVTSFACLPDTDPPIDSEPVLEFVARRAREVKRVKVYAYGCVTRGAAGQDLAEYGLLKAAGAVAFTDGRRAVGDARVMMRALSYGTAHGILIVQHPEEPRLAEGGQMNAGGDRDPPRPRRHPPDRRSDPCRARPAVGRRHRRALSRGPTSRRPRPWTRSAPPNAQACRSAAIPPRPISR